MRIFGTRFFYVGCDDVVWVIGAEGTGRTGRRQIKAKIKLAIKFDYDYFYYFRWKKVNY